MARPNIKQKVIEDAAIKLFATKGLARTVIKDIAKEAGVTEGALYRHYKSKNDLAWVLFMREVKKFSEELDAIFSGRNHNAVEKIAAAIRFMYRYYEDHPLHFAFILLTQHGFPEEKLLDERLNPNDLVQRFIADVVQVNGLSEDKTGVLTGMVMGLVMQPVVMHWYGRLEKRPLNYVDDVIGASLRVLAINGQGGR